MTAIGLRVSDISVQGCSIVIVQKASVQLNCKYSQLIYILKTVNYLYSKNSRTKFIIQQPNIFALPKSVCVGLCVCVCVCVR